MYARVPLCPRVRVKLGEMSWREGRRARESRTSASDNPCREVVLVLRELRDLVQLLRPSFQILRLYGVLEGLRINNLRLVRAAGGNDAEGLLVEWDLSVQGGRRSKAGGTGEREELHFVWDECCVW